MSYEFMKLSDVEVVETPTENANVLIEEDGIIKKAPKTAVGGAGGSVEPDMVITVTGESATKITSDNYAITEGSVDAVFTAFHEGRYPIIKVRFHQNDNDAYTAIREEYDAYACTYGESLWFNFIALNPYDSTNLYVHKVYMNGDGTLSSVNLCKATLTNV